MPELTVLIYAHNCEDLIQKTLEAVLNQEEVDIGVCVVDDCSNDNTVNKVSSFTDSRLSLIKNSKRIGKHKCFNLAIQNCESPFITLLDSNNILFDRYALKKIVNEIKKSEKTGKLHIYDIRADYYGNLTRKDVERRWNNLPKLLNKYTDFRRDLIVKGNILNNPTTYRKKTFDDIGLFNENISSNTLPEFEMSLRILNKYEIALLPEYLCCINRKTTTKKQASISRDLELLIKRTRIASNLFKTNNADYFDSFQYNLFRMFVLGCLNLILKRSKILKQKIK